MKKWESRWSFRFAGDEGTVINIQAPKSYGLTHAERWAWLQLDEIAGTDNSEIFDLIRIDKEYGTEEV